MLKIDNKTRLLITAAALLLGSSLLSGCAVGPDRPAFSTAQTDGDALDEALARPLIDNLSPADLNPLGQPTGPRMKRASKPGLDRLPPPLDIESDVAAGLEDEFPADLALDLESAPAEPGDLWARIRDGLSLTQKDNARVKTATTWYTRHPRYMERVAQQAAPYLHYIYNEVEQRGMPAEIALLPVVESAYQPFALSTSRASGLWQFIPDTGKRFGLKRTWWYDGRRDVVASTQAALDYLQYLHDLFDGDWLLALAAYNSGEGTIAKAIRENKRLGKPTDYWSLNLPPQTQEYVPRLLAISAIVARPDHEGIALAPIADLPYLASVEVNGQLDFAVAAELADMSMEELHRLNPGHNHWATDPDGGPHKLLLPADRVEAFNAGLAELPPEQRVRWVRHQVRGGESLDQLAHRYATEVRVLARINQLGDKPLRPGQELIVPLANGASPEDTVDEVIPATNTYTHRVVAGDTLSLVSRRYGVPVKQLAAWNKLASKAKLHTGQQLIVKAGARTEAVARAGGKTKKSDPRKIVYTVRAGDSLALISKRFKVSVKQLQTWNRLSKNLTLQPGQRLTLFVNPNTNAGAG